MVALYGKKLIKYANHDGIYALSQTVPLPPNCLHLFRSIGTQWSLVTGYSTIAILAVL